MSTNTQILDEPAKQTLKKIPLLKVNAGPRDAELWLERLKEEYNSLIAFINNNKANDTDWFRLESNAEGTRWFGKCWFYHKMIKYLFILLKLYDELLSFRYEFNVEFDIPVTYPKTAPEIGNKIL